MKRKINTLSNEIKGGNLHRIFRRTYQNIFKFYYYFDFNKPDGISVLEKEWDVLLVLDACRFDSFKKYNNIKGKLNSIISKGTCTVEWLNSNFGMKKKYNDIVYVSGNPFTEYSIEGSKKFYDVSNVFLKDWNEKFGTVLPDSVSSEAIRMHKKHPDKKLIVHYMQPHVPYVGKTKIYLKNSFKSKNFSKENNGHDWFGSLLDKIRYEGGSVRMFYKAYIENLRLVLRSIENLLPHLEGKVIISSDHGELFGEKYIYGHPPGIRLKKITKVPWFVVDMEYYKEKASEVLPLKNVKMKEKGEGDEEKIKKKLKALGYK